MRTVLIMVATALLLLESGGSAKLAPTDHSASAVPVTSSSKPDARVDFDTQIKPILHSKCMPCHFSGGQMYARLPFDKPDTIRKLGVRLFTRIKEKDDQELIENFLSQSP